jgi:hypothetical protein
MTKERPLPPHPQRRAVLVVVCFIGLAALTLWLMLRTGNQVLPVLLFTLPAVIVYFYYLRRRCPECHSRLKVRRDFIDNTRKYRFLLDCQTCQIAWDTGQIGDDEGSFG